VGPYRSFEGAILSRPRKRNINLLHQMDNLFSLLAVTEIHAVTCDTVLHDFYHPQTIQLSFIHAITPSRSPSERGFTGKVILLRSTSGRNKLCRSEPQCSLQSTAAEPTDLSPSWAKHHGRGKTWSSLHGNHD